MVQAGNVVDCRLVTSMALPVLLVLVQRNESPLDLVDNVHLIGLHHSAIALLHALSPCVDLLPNFFDVGGTNSDHN